MIKSVELFNFQSHKHTLVEFDKGINIISGTSDSGKSALMRAIRYVTQNAPSGLSVISWWAFNGKKQKEDCRVILTLEDGTTVERVRGSINAYIINRELPLEAVGTTVPEQVQKLLNFSEINIQRQLDAPFLLSDSPGDVARFLNKIVNMEEADLYQGAIEAKRRRITTDITTANTNLARAEKELLEFEWLEKAEKLTGRIEKLEGENDTILESTGDIERSIYELRRQGQILNTCACISRAVELDDAIMAQIALRNTHSNYINDAQASIDRYTQYSKESSVDVTMMDKLVHKIDRMVEDTGVIKTEVSTATISITQYKNSADILEYTTEELDPLEKEVALVDVCPLCGKALEHTTCAF